MKHIIKWFSEGIIEIFLDPLLSLNTNLNLDTYLYSFFFTNFLVPLARSRELIHNMLSTELMLRFERLYQESSTVLIMCRDNTHENHSAYAIDIVDTAL